MNKSSILTKVFDHNNSILDYRPSFDDFIANDITMSISHSVTTTDNITVTVSESNNTTVTTGDSNNITVRVLYSDNTTVSDSDDDNLSLYVNPGDSSDDDDIDPDKLIHESYTVIINDTPIYENYRAGSGAASIAKPSSDDIMANVINKTIGRQRFRFIKYLLSELKGLNIHKIIMKTFKKLLNSINIMQLFFNTGYRLNFANMPSRDVQQICFYLMDAKLDFIKLIINNGAKLEIILRQLSILDFRDVNIIYWLLDNGHELLFSNIANEITNDQIKIMIEKASKIGAMAFYDLYIHGRLEDLYSDNFVFDLIDKGVHIENEYRSFNLLATMLLFFDTSDELDKVFHLFDLTKTLEVYVSSKYDIALNGVRYLIERGARVDNYKIINNVCYRGDIEIAKLLIDHGAPIQIQFPTDTVLGVTVCARHYDLAKYLIKRGSNPTHALLLIAHEMNEIQMKFLVDHGADPTYIIYELDSDDSTITQLLRIRKYSIQTKEILYLHYIK